MRQWAEMTSVALAGLPRSLVAILPVAAIEQHGPHLPLDTDCRIAVGILDRALALLPSEVPALALPLVPYGHSPEHQSFPGTLSISAATALRLCTELGENLKRNGVNRLILFTAHGGNPPLLDLIAIDLRTRLGMAVVPIHWGDFGIPDGLFPEMELIYGIHGGAVETSLMLRLHPGSVRLEAVQDFPSTAPGLAARMNRLRQHGKGGLTWAAEDLNPKGVVGDARLATVAAGENLLTHAAKALAELIADLSRLDWPAPEDGVSA